MTQLSQAKQIILPESKWEEIQAHCRRKLEGDFLPGETEVNRAYGILAGTISKSSLIIDCVMIVKKNARNVEPLKTYMDTVMGKHAKPSTTPLSQRGWITDPEELKCCLDQCENDNLQIFGTYHIHIVPWEGDPKRDTPTHLDAILAQNSNLYTFIIGMVDDSKPSIRAFYEGALTKEVPVILKADQ